MPTTNARRGRLSSRPFYTTALLLSLFTAYSFLSHAQHRFRGPRGGGVSLLKRGDEEPECRQVHAAEDQCAFVKQYCGDEDAGLLPYLQLYYCAFGHVQPVAFVILVGWLGLLFTTIGIAASDFFSINLSTIATILGLSESLAGVTFLAFGNGSPDVFSTFAAMNSNSASMAVGELIGAASFITGVVAGSMALVREFRVDRKTYFRDIIFFIGAVVGTMAFLGDGQLHFWECCAMVGYYVFYVVSVVGLHWYTTRRKRSLLSEGEARSHLYGSVGHAGAELASETYRDDPDNIHQGPDRPSPESGPERSMSAPENAPRIEVDGQAAEADLDIDSDDTDDHDRMVAAEVSRSMRVLRPSVQSKRKNTLTTIRPSLVGALEFRSALAHLQRESNLQLSAIPARSYSDGRQRGRTNCTVPDPSQPDQHASLTSHGAGNARERALSSGNVPASSSMPPEVLDAGRDRSHSSLSLPSLTLPQGQMAGQRTPSPAPSYVIDGKLAPPPAGQPGPFNDTPGHESRGDTLAPRPQLQTPSRRSSHSDMSSPHAPFPRYTDSPMIPTPNPQSEQGEFALPPPAHSHCDGPFAILHNSGGLSRPVRWWPYSVLPSPRVLLATLFPTLQGWGEKAYWDKFLSAISVPSIFLLVVTLPVVESETTEEQSLDDSIADHSSCRAVGHMAPPISVQPGEIEPEDEWERFRRHSMSRRSSLRSSANVPPSLLSLQAEDTVVAPTAHVGSGPPPGMPKPVSEIHSVSQACDEKPGWNRWLVCLQLFTGPVFAVFILWANMLEDWENPGTALVYMLLWTLLGSCVLLVMLLLCTSGQKRPKYHFLFCFMGFIISIAWISTIAGEVVGVLKTFGVVLGISEALLGLTVFAAGNSVGDLVADITMARLGYPVMALSACFGGPMLNILLGIGIGGVLMMVQDANHHQHKHPDREYHYGPYRVQIGGTLVISSITLVVTLVGLLLVVPMNKWILSRKIGWGLIALWLASTIANVVVEVTGALDEIA